MADNPYDTDLGRTPTNYQPLTPLTFLERAAGVFPDHIAIVHGTLRRSYAEFHARSVQLASALDRRGVGHGDTVSVLLANTPAMLECHYGVPMCGAVLHSINTRQDAAGIAFQLDHVGSAIVIADREFMPIMQQALALASVKPVVVQYADPEFAGPYTPVEAVDYETFVSEGDPSFAWPMPRDEWDAISINYTSGTTGDPKGVVCHHRGAYLLAQGNALTTSMRKHAVYLWTLPMFHCNGWCFPWTLSAIVGTHVCLRQVRVEPIWNALADEGVTHLCGAPSVMSLMIAAPEKTRRELEHAIQFFTAAAPPPEKLLADMRTAGFEVTHLYGLTETYGPAVVNDWHEEWFDLPPARAGRAEIPPRRALPAAGATGGPRSRHDVPGAARRQDHGRGHVSRQRRDEGLFPQPRGDAEGLWPAAGSIPAIWGSCTPTAMSSSRTDRRTSSFREGRTSRRSRSRKRLYRHPAVAVAAVVAMPHEKWGETPCAFIELVTGRQADAETLLAWCREHLARYKVPRRFVFMLVPKTSTGKVQKVALREYARSARSEDR